MLKSCEMNLLSVFVFGEKTRNQRKGGFHISLYCITCFWDGGFIFNQAHVLIELYTIKNQRPANGVRKPFIKSASGNIAMPYLMCRKHCSVGLMTSPLPEPCFLWGSWKIEEEENRNEKTTKGHAKTPINKGDKTMV